MMREKREGEEGGEWRDERREKIEEQGREEEDQLDRIRAAQGPRRLERRGSRGLGKGGKVAGAPASHFGTDACTP